MECRLQKSSTLLLSLYKYKVSAPALRGSSLSRRRLRCWSSWSWCCRCWNVWRRAQRRIRRLSTQIITGYFQIVRNNIFFFRPRGFTLITLLNIQITSKVNVYTYIGVTINTHCCVRHRPSTSHVGVRIASGLFRCKLIMNRKKTDVKILAP